jgi:hypothetical protein
LGQPRDFKYDLPRLARGDTLVESFDEADDTADRGDQASESLATDDGGDDSYVASRLDGRRRGLSGNVGLVQSPLVTGPLRDGGGDMDFCCGEKPKTRRLVNSASVSSGDSALMASRNRWASTIRKVFGCEIAEGITGDCSGDIVGVSGGVAKPIEGCNAVAAVAAVAIDTVAMT